MLDVISWLLGGVQWTARRCPSHDIGRQAPCEDCKEAQSQRDGNVGGGEGKQHLGEQQLLLWGAGSQAWRAVVDILAAPRPDQTRMLGGRQPRGSLKLSWISRRDTRR